MAMVTPWTASKPQLSCRAVSSGSVVLSVCSTSKLYRMTAVLGGGISGLSAAYYLLKNSSQNVTIIEKSNVFGGWIRSIKYPNEGFIFEKGPRSVRPKGPQGLNTLTIIEDLNLTHKVVHIPNSHPTARNRMIYAKNQLHTLPSSFSSLFQTCSPLSKPIIYSAFTDLTAPITKADDESIYSFVDRRFGKEVADYLISSMICGICAGDAKEVSVKFLMAEMFDWEKKHGSVIKGLLKKAFSKRNETITKLVESSALCRRATEERWSVWYMKDGLQQLPESLGGYVQKKGAKVKFNSKCRKMEFNGKHQVICEIDNLTELTSNKMFDHIVCSLPATTLAKLVAKQHPVLSKDLSEIKSVTVAVVNIAFKGNHLKENAFGFLVPPKEKLPILGVIFDSCNFEYENYTVLTVMLGGKWYDEYFGPLATEKTICETALQQVSKILGIQEEPEITDVSILENCIPQYTVGHHERVKRILSYIKKHELPLSVVGSSYFGVGINDVIYSAKNAVEHFQKKQC